MKRRVLLTLLVLLFPLLAQEAKKEDKPAPVSARPKDWVTKVIPVKRVDMSSFVQLIRPLGVQVDASGAFQSLVVTGPPEAVAAAEAIIKQYDVPPPPPRRYKNIELTAYLVSALPQPAQQEVMPNELEGVIKQMKSLFAYRGYRLLDTLIVRTREGQGIDLASAGLPAGVTPSPANHAPVFSLRIKTLSLSETDKGNVVRLDGLRLGARVPEPIGESFQYLDTGINTDLDVREGQKVVVGKTGMGNEALILVVTAKVVE